MVANKVRVTIYGQQYTISGERSEAQIEKIAAFVDTQIREMSKFYNGSQPGSLATLAAVNIADELYVVRDENEKLRGKVAQLTEDCRQYVQMCEDAKASLSEYKEKAGNLSSEAEKNSKKIEELEAKVREYEVCYFELQAENVRLQNRINTYDSMK